MRPYHVRVAVGAEQPSDSFVWLHPDGKPHGETRDRFLARIHHQKRDGRTAEVQVEVRLIASLSTNRLNDLTKTWNSQKHAPLLRISRHYRDLLGILDDQVNSDGAIEKIVELEITPTNNPIDAIKACLVHPQLIVRIATRLGVFGVLTLPSSLAPSGIEDCVKLANIAIIVLSCVILPDLAFPWRVKR